MRPPRTPSPELAPVEASAATFTVVEPVEFPVVGGVDDGVDVDGVDVDGVDVDGVDVDGVDVDGVDDALTLTMVLPEPIA